MMNWYLAKIVFQIKTENKAIGQFDEQMRLIYAGSLQDAFLKARLLGVRNEEQTGNETVSGVSWEFVDVAHLQEVEAFYDGMELCSRVHETEETTAYIHFIKSQALAIEENTSTTKPGAVSLAR